MKKILFIFSIIGLFLFNSCSDMLDTDPTDKVSGTANLDRKSTRLNTSHLVLH